MAKPKFAIDTCSILHLLLKTPKWFDVLREIHDDARRNRIQLLVSEISVAECNKLVVDKVELPDGPAIIAEYFKKSYLERRGFTGRESAFATSIIREHELGTCDAIIAATAIYFDCSTLYTSDGCGQRKEGRLRPADKLQTPCGKSMTIRCPDEYVPLE